MYNILHAHSFASWDCISDPNKMIAKAASFNMGAMALTDHHTLGTIPSFWRAADKAGIKPLLGIELYVCTEHESIKTPENRKLDHLVLIAKNLRGWKTLLKIVELSNREENYYYKPRISLDTIAQLNESKDLIAISAHPGSSLFSPLWSEGSNPYDAKTYEEAKACADMANWEMNMMQAIGYHQEVFGKENLFLEIQRIDEDRLFCAQISNKALRYLAKKYKLQSVATNDPHYINREDAILQRILLTDRLKTSLYKIESKLVNNEEVGMGGFFRSDKYYIHSPDEMSLLHTEAELKASLDIADMVEKYEINSAPKCPKFDTPNGSVSADYLANLCRVGFDRLVRGKVDDEARYETQYKYELDIFNQANLADYFLIVRDIIENAKANGGLAGPGRGSCAGSLVAYLIGITQKIDPIKNNLLFERFVNPDRLKRGELPDIDVDLEINKRQDSISYIVDKYGSNKVCQVATFGSYKGKSALRLVLRAMEVPFQQQLEMTEYLPDESKVTDDLEEFITESGEKSLLKLFLKDYPEKLNKYAKLEKDGSISGDYSEAWLLASRLEFTRSHTGKHAAAVLIAVDPLVQTVPMIKPSKGHQLIAGWEFKDCEWAGLMKLDALGIMSLDVLNAVMYMEEED